MTPSIARGERLADAGWTDGAGSSRSTPDVDAIDEEPLAAAHGQSSAEQLSSSRAPRG
jgi:hypothetical protein